MKKSGINRVVQRASSLYRQNIKKQTDFDFSLLSLLKCRLLTTFIRSEKLPYRACPFTNSPLFTFVFPAEQHECRYPAERRRARRGDHYEREITASGPARRMRTLLRGFGGRFGFLRRQAVHRQGINQFFAVGARHRYRNHRGIAGDRRVAHCDCGGLVLLYAIYVYLFGPERHAYRVFGTVGVELRIEPETFDLQARKAAVSIPLRSASRLMWKGCVRRTRG